MENNTGETNVPVSQIVITFPAPGYADCKIDIQNVSALQAISAAWMLSKQAELGFMQNQMAKAEAEQKRALLVPKPRMPGSDGILKGK